jgi:signal transduction histidine kinase
MSFFELFLSYRFYNIGYFTGFISTLIMAVFVGLAKPRRPEARLWALLSLLVSIWFLGRFKILNAASPADAFFWQRVMYFGAVPLDVVYFHFVLAFIGCEKRRIVLWVGYAMTTALVLLNFTTHLFVMEMIPTKYFGLFEVPGPIYHIHTLIYAVYPSYGVYLLVRARRTVDRVRRNQLDYVILASIIGFMSGFSTIPAVFKTNFPPVGGPFVSVYAFIVFYAIFKHQLMDIRVVIKRTLLYSTVSAILVAVYVGIISILTKALEGYFVHAPAFSSAVAAAAIALLFHPLRARLQFWLDRHFPRESLDQNMLREATGHFVHEIKRPLANISMPAQLALTELDRMEHGGSDWKEGAPELRRKLEYILRESMNAGDTMEAIRALSSGTLQTPQPVDLEQLLNRVLEREQSRIVQQKIEVIPAFENPAPVVSGNPKQLEIAIANIVKNAVDAMAGMTEGKPRRLRLSIQSQTDAVQIGIEDSGPGIPRADLPKLFDPWFSTKGSSGMGIGLFLTREVLRLHGAGIEVDSYDGEGCRFRLTFPCGS